MKKMIMGLVVFGVIGGGATMAVNASDYVPNNKCELCNLEMEGYLEEKYGENWAKDLAEKYGDDIDDIIEEELEEKFGDDFDECDKCDDKIEEFIESKLGIEDIDDLSDLDEEDEDDDDLDEDNDDNDLDEDNYDL